MSRGPGIWQRGILTALEHYPYLYVRDLLPDHARKSDRNAIERAAWTLQSAGRIELLEFAFGHPRLLAVRRGFPVTGRPSPARRRPLIVGEVPIANSTHTYRDAKTAAWAAGRPWPAYQGMRFTVNGQSRHEDASR